jgi:hypothetical protein
MTALDYQDKEFQDLIRRELMLTKEAVFASCKIFKGSPVAEHCIGIVREREITNILIHGSYEISGDAIIFSLNFPGAPDPRVARQEIDKAGLDVEKTRFVGVCVRSPGKGEVAVPGPEIQIVFMPFLPLR